MQDAAHADKNARPASILDEGNLFCIEKAERRFRLQMVSETVQQGLLIVAVLHPSLAEIAQVWFAFLLFRPSAIRRSLRQLLLRRGFAQTRPSQAVSCHGTRNEM